MKRGLLLIAILIVPIHGAAAKDQSPARTARASSLSARQESALQAERELAWTISEPRMQATVRQLYLIGPRMGGTRSNRTSAAWLAGRFRAAGLEVTIREDSPVRFHEQDEWEVTVVGGETLAAAWPRGGSPSADGTGPLSTTPAEGAVWLTSENPSVEDARGGLAVLFDGRASASGWPMAGRLRGDWTVPVFGIATEEGVRLRALLAEDPGAQMRIRLVSRTGQASPHTVVATLPGRDRSRFVLFCAHGDSDSGGPGADDNASGAAIVLEVARAMSAAVRAGIIPRPAYDVRFAIWGTEIGATREFVRELLEQDAMPEAVINYDQSGYGTWRDAIYFEPDDVPENVGLITLIRTVAQDHLGAPGFPERFASAHSQGGTDSYVFQQERLVGESMAPAITVYSSAWGRLRPLDVTPGFPPVNWYEDEEEGKVTVDGDAFYHSSGDTPANTTDREPWNMGWCARLGLLTALRFVNDGPPGS